MLNPARLALVTAAVLVIRCDSRCYALALWQSFLQALSPHFEAKHSYSSGGSWTAALARHRCAPALTTQHSTAPYLRASLTAQQHNTTRVATRRQRAAGQAIEQAVELSPPSSPSGTMSRSSSMESLTNSIRRTKNRVKETVRRRKKQVKDKVKREETS